MPHIGGRLAAFEPQQHPTRPPQNLIEVLAVVDTLAASAAPAPDVGHTDLGEPCVLVPRDGCALDDGVLPHLVQFGRRPDLERRSPEVP